MKITPLQNGIIRIAHCGDPQLGFSEPRGSEDAYRDDLARCERLIAKINEMDLDLVYIAGDMVNDPRDSGRDWPRLLKLFRHPLVIAPGNHDLGQALTVENLDRFIEIFGCDHASLKIGKWRLICGNSQYWMPTEALNRKMEYEKWFDDALSCAKANGEPIILATHISPFIVDTGEADSYNNAPLAIRAGLVEKLLDAGVKFHLGGHTHRMFARAHRGMVLLNPECTCASFDNRPYGFRLLEIADNGDYSWTFTSI